MSLRPPESVGKLQSALHAKAKADPAFRFYSLADKVWRRDVLHYAWERCRLNGGKPGVDGQTFEQIEAQGVEAWLDGLTQELTTGTYRPQAVRRVNIPRPDGKLRPLGIPTIKDRVAQMAVVIVIEPIFEADLADEQYAYRSGRSAHDAINQVHRMLHRGHREVVDADLSGYFDSIPHHELMKSVARRISDGKVLHLIKQWLEMPVESMDERGRKQRTTSNKDSGRGTPQGAPISPLLANLYMRRFILGWKQQGHEHRFGACIVNYADDFVILCRHNAQGAKERMQQIMGKLKLTVNERKTAIRHAPQESFDFLGYTLGWCYSMRTGHAFIGTRPSRKRVQRLCREITEMTRRNWLKRTVEEVVGEMNRKLRGWANYFCLGSVSNAYRALDNHARHRLRQWLCGKYQLKGKGRRPYLNAYLHEDLGLIELKQLARSPPWAKA